MSTQIHQMILLPSSNFKIFCVDGMTQEDVEKLGKILNFGANLRFANCGATTEFNIIYKA